MRVQLVYDPEVSIKAVEGVRVRAFWLHLRVGADYAHAVVESVQAVVVPEVFITARHRQGVVKNDSRLVSGGREAVYVRALLSVRA